MTYCIEYKKQGVWRKCGTTPLPHETSGAYQHTMPDGTYTPLHGLTRDRALEVMATLSNLGGSIKHRLRSE